MKNTELIFKNSEEKEATEKVLATFKGKKINENIDTLVSEILNYAKKIDEILKSVDIESSYLDMVSNLNSTNEIVLKEDINDEKVKENVEDLIKRINTRINLIHSNDKVLKELTEKYVTPHVRKWEALDITPSKNYYDWRLEDGSGRLTDIFKCNKCNNKWKDLLSKYKKCPYCCGTSIKRNFKYGTKVQVINPFDGKKLSKDESVIYNYLTKVHGFLPVENEAIHNRFIPNYRENYSMERDFYFPYYILSLS